MSRLHLINETDLRRGGILGYGAFGTVFRGFWIPPQAKVKVPVAIKELHDCASDAQKEMLDEAQCMAGKQSFSHLLQVSDLHQL